MAPTTDGGNIFESFTMLSVLRPCLDSINHDRMVNGLVSNMVSYSRSSQVQPPWLQKWTFKVDFSFHKVVPQIGYSFKAVLQLF